MDDLNKEVAAVGFDRTRIRLGLRLNTLCDISHIFMKLKTLEFI